MTGVSSLEKIIAYRGTMPRLNEDVFVAPGAWIIGDVVLEKGVNIWYNTVLRGDVNAIFLGEYTNIQDNSMIHCDAQYPTRIGRYVTVGHNAVLHACTIQDFCLVGMGAIILDGAEVGEGSIVGAGAVVTGGTKIPPYSLVLGTPGKISKTLEQKTRELRQKHALRYYELSRDYR